MAMMAMMTKIFSSKIVFYAALGGLIASMIMQPGIASAVSTLCFIGWLLERQRCEHQEHALRQAGLELEISAKRSDALQQKLENSLVMRVDNVTKEATITDDIGPTSGSVH